MRKTINMRFDLRNTYKVGDQAIINNICGQTPCTVFKVTKTTIQVKLDFVQFINRYRSCKLKDRMIVIPDKFGLGYKFTLRMTGEVKEVGKYKYSAAILTPGSILNKEI